MAFPQGINFRGTSGYVTDGANEYCQIQPLTGGNYPTTTPQGNTVGWEGTAYLQIGSRDRSTSIDRRLAGTNYANTAAIAMYRIDLPAAGSYNVRLAAGDAQYSASVQVELFDNSASLGVLASGAPAAGQFMDAAGSTLSAANWPAQNAAASKTFSSTICRIGVGSAAANNKVIAHFYIEAAASQPKSYTLTAASGSFALTGAAATLRASRVMRAASGSFALAGSPARLSVARRLSGSAGAFALSGSETALRVSRRLAAAPGAYSLAGSDALLTYQQNQVPDPEPQQYRLTASPGSFELAGAAAAMRVQRRLVAGTGAFSISGMPAVLAYQPGSSAGGTEIDVSQISTERIVVFEGSGSRIVIFDGSGNRVRFDQMSARVPIKIGEKWTVDRDPDEISYYAADITEELLARNTTADQANVVPVLFGVELLEGPELQVATIDGVERTFVVVKLGGTEDPLPDDWRWVARVPCINGERFDKTTWFNKVDP